MDFDLSDVRLYADSQSFDEPKVVSPHAELNEDLKLISRAADLTIDFEVKELQVELEGINKILDKLKL